ncbi:response regulator [Aeromicrobium sp. CF3.5]|uniref:response regulator n=1 Tax=Aeromicrobium sp. CF3.5 TaxID=3373078 RepID=UPI003EE764FB
MSDKITVFLLDDHEVVRQGIKSLIEQHDDLTVVGEAGMAADALRQIPQLKPDVAVLDGRLPDGTGVEVCRDVRSRHPQTAVLILTSYEDDEAMFSAVMAGAAGYVLKQVRGIEIVDSIRRVAAGESLLDPTVTQKVLERIRAGAPVADPVDKLTRQERRILEYIGEGLTNRQIAEEMFLAEKTIKNYVTQMLAKLGLQRRTQAAVLVTKRGGSLFPEH